MTAPAPTVRATPNGRKLKTGFKSLITFARVPDLAIFEMAVTPPGFDGKEPVDTTTMHNTVWDTMAPRKLVKMTNIKGKCAYDPKVWSDILSCLNIEDTITKRWSDGSTIAAFGFLNKFDPDEESEDKMPTASFEIVITNTDPTTGAEQAPVVNAVSGT